MSPKHTGLAQEAATRSTEYMTRAGIRLGRTYHPRGFPSPDLRALAWPAMEPSLRLAKKQRADLSIPRGDARWELSCLRAPQGGPCSLELRRDAVLACSVLIRSPCSNSEAHTRTAPAQTNTEN